METTGVKGYKYSIVTFVFGTYEKLHEIGEVEEGVEYICVTDNENLKSDTWTIVIDHELDGKGVFDKCFSVRYNLFKYCHSDICVRVDGSIGIHKSITPLVDAFIKSDDDVCLLIHPYRDNLIVEYNAWLQYRGFPLERAQKHVKFLQSIGYDFNRKGLIQLNFSINKRSKLTDDIDRLMYAIQRYLGDEKDIDRLDQTIITAVLDRFFPDIKVFCVGEDILHSSYMTWYAHNSDREIGYSPSHVLTPHLFDKEVQTISL